LKEAGVPEERITILVGEGDDGRRSNGSHPLTGSSSIWHGHCYLLPDMMGAACVTTTFRRLGALALLAVAAPAGAQAFEDLGQLEMVVAAALGAGIGEPGGASRPLDRRLS
jgi:hypothetical protein